MRERRAEEKKKSQLNGKKIGFRSLTTRRGKAPEVREEACIKTRPVKMELGNVRGQRKGGKCLLAWIK